MRYCDFCKKELPDGFDFCPDCGKPTAPKAAQPAPAPAAPASAPAGDAPKIKICRKCGQKNDARNEYCVSCLSALGGKPGYSAVSQNVDPASATQTNVYAYSPEGGSAQTANAAPNNTYTGTSHYMQRSFTDEENPIWYMIFKYLLLLDAALATFLGLIFFFVFLGNDYAGYAFLSLIGFPITFWFQCAVGMLFLEHFKNVKKIRKIMESQTTKEK